MKRLIKKTIEQLGYDIIPYDASSKILESNASRWLQAMEINTVIDAGASNGGFARRIRKILPRARIISFEALQDSYDELNQRMKQDENFESHGVALSNSNGKAVFQMASSVGSSSLLSMAELHKSAYPASSGITEIEVECKKLDDVLDAAQMKKNILFKLDVQGAEKMVMEGAENTLRNTELIFSEVNFQELYHGCVLFTDLVDYLQQRSFRVIGIENVSQNINDGTFLQADAWFQRIP